MINKPLISVVTATYNSAATIEDTLRSVVGQTYGFVEHIIIDGGSSDSTLEIVKSYLDTYSSRGYHLKWISEKDRGIYDAMNKGIVLATGEIIGLLNSDDYYTAPTVLERVADTFVADLDAVYGDIHYIHPSSPGKCVRYYSSKGFRRWKMRMGFMPAHPSFYCRREIYTRHGLFDIDFRIAADFEQLLRLIFLHRIRTQYIPMDFVTMRTGGASSSGFASHRRIYSEIRKAFKKNNVYSNFMLQSLRYAYKVYEVCRTNLS